MTSAPFNVNLRVLEAPGIRLLPVSQDHVEELFAATPEDTFAYYPFKPNAWTLAGFREYVETLQPRGMNGLVVEVEGKLVGMSTFMDIRPEHRGLEVGHTFIAPQYRGSWVNPAMKLLMIDQAIEEFGAIRVQLKTDGRNWASRNAMTKMGFPFEGIYRNHIIMPNGHYRDTVMFAVTPDDWPEVKAVLEALIQSRRT